jgi:hypothetical protein
MGTDMRALTGGPQQRFVMGRLNQVLMFETPDIFCGIRQEICNNLIFREV